MKYTLLLLLSLLVFSCNTKQGETEKKESKIETVAFKNEGHKLVYNFVQKVGTYQDLLKKKDVVFTYTYKKGDGKTDVSTEKYVFNGELSYGKYTTHENTFPKLEGTLEQAYDGSEYWMKNESTAIIDEKILKKVAFRRPTNFYWFAMFQKLLDPSVNYEYVGNKEIDSKKYDIVNVSFSSDKPTDIYQVFINQDTGLIDQFLFTVADFGVMDEPRLMQVEYETVDGMLIPSKRKYKKSDWNATVSDKPWIFANWTNIKFNNGLTVADFKK